MGGEFGGEWITYIGRAESFRCTSETTSTLFISYTPTQSKKFKVWVGGGDQNTKKWEKHNPRIVSVFFNGINLD